MDLLLASPLGRAGALVALLGATTLAWFVLSRRSGRMRTVPVRSAGDPRGVLDPASVGATFEAAATFVQFSSAVCSPCRHVARVLTALSAVEPDVAHIELDVTQHAELVRTHGVLRTPTVLLVGPDGAIHARTSGPMTPVQARDALIGLDPDRWPAPSPRPASPPAPAAPLTSHAASHPAPHLNPAPHLHPRPKDTP